MTRCGCFGKGKAEPPSHFATAKADGSLSEISEEWKGSLVVSLQKKEGCSLGLTVSGGTDKGQRPQVSNLRPGSIAHRCDALQVGDFIISVNDIRTSGLRHEEIINLLKNAGTNVSLEVEYEIPQPGPSSQNILTKQQEIVLDKEPSGFGFTLRGGMQVDRMKAHPLTVVAIRAGGPADREGSVKVGDRVIAVNGYRLAHLSLTETLVVLSQCESPASFSVAYDAAVMDEVESASGPVLLEIDRAPGSCIGLTLAPATYEGKCCLSVSQVQPMSISDRCGALHEGDHILAIDEVSVEAMSIAEAGQLLKAGTEACVRLEVVPATHLDNCAKRESLVNNSVISAVSTPYLSQSLSTHSGMTLSKSAINQDNYRNNNNTYNNNNNNNNHHHHHLHHNSNGTGFISNGTSSGSHSHLHHSFADNTSVSVGMSQFGTLNMRKRGGLWGQGPERRAASCMSIASSSNSVLSSGNQVCHTETIEVILFADMKGLGMTLKGGLFPSAPLSQPPTIANIESRSPADKCGVLQEGDRILSINGVDTIDRSMEEVNRFLRESRPRCILLVEFDVTESVIASSGTFIVKLAKKSGDTGITINANVSTKNGKDSLIISSVRRGSVAHRSGTIQAGDKLLAINDVRLEMFTPDDAMHLLELPDDIVKLKLRRDDPDEGHEGCIIYTVELQRYGGPLGITISGTEDPCDPIVISELTPQGLAERTGAIHVGDRLLAVSGNTTKNKPLSEAIRMLQNAGDVVTLKIARPDPASIPEGVPLQPYDLTNLSSPTTPIPSVDSAMESWTSSVHDVQGSSSTSNSKTGPSSNGRSSDPKLQGNINVMVLAIPQDSSGHNYNMTDMDHDGSERPQSSLEWDEGSNPSLSSSNREHGDGMTSDDSNSSGMGDWVKTLERLDMGSGSEMLRQIGLSLRQRSEVSLNEGEGYPPALKSRSKSTSRVGGRGGAKSNTDIHHDSSISKENKLKEYNKSAVDVYAVPNKISRKPAVAPKPARLVNSKSTTLPPTLPSRDETKTKETKTSSKDDHTKTIFTPSPIQLQRVVLEKSDSKEDFGFALSDGLYENGVYINSVRKDSPADVAGLRKYDRVLQVNKDKVQDFDCKQTIPLIAGSGKKLRLVVCRNPLLRLSNSIRDEKSDQNGWKKKDMDPKTTPGFRGRVAGDNRGQKGKT